jgi:hypothetical protein
VIRFSAPLLCWLLISTATVFAGETEYEKLVSRIRTPKEDTTTGATLLVGEIAEMTAKAAATASGPQRRSMELLICDLEDQLEKNVSADSYKVYTSSFNRVAPEAQAEICFALRRAPANAEFDAAVAKALSPSLEYRIKVASLDVLAAHKYAGAVEKILPLVAAKEPLPVQISACRALAQLPDKRSVPALIKYMQECKEKAIGRGMYESCGALRAISRLDYMPDPGTWKGWWDSNEKTFEPKPDAAPDFNYELKSKTDVSYYEIPLIENRIVFVLDVSGSMVAGGKPNRLQSAVTELSALIGRMTDKQNFNIVTFSTHTHRWQDAPMVQASEPMKKAAKAFLESLVPKGGTQTAEAFEEVLQRIVTATSCETVFLVSDGGPNPWAKEIKVADQVRLITWINQFLKVRIHSIGIYSKAPTDPPALLQEDLADMKAFLETLAVKNDGAYKEVGK